MTGRRCGRCGIQQPMEWTPDREFGPAAESIRCPACGAVWGVRTRGRVIAGTVRVARRWRPWLLDAGAKALGLHPAKPQQGR
jgi:hypothetical protein